MGFSNAGMNVFNGGTVFGATTFELDNVTTAQTGILSVFNATAATGAIPQQYSPGIELKGNGWTGAASFVGKYMIQAQPAAAASQVDLVFFNSVGGAYAEAFRWKSVSGSFQSPLATGMKLLSPAGSGSVSTDDAVGSQLAYNGTSLTVGNGSGGFTSAAGDSGTNVLFGVNAGTAQVTSGSTFFRIADGVGVGNLRVGTITRVQNTLCYAEDLTATGTVAAGDVVVWAGTDGKTVAKAGATGNLTTIAGVAVTGGTSATIIVGRRGRCYATADASGAPAYTVGQLCGTSGNTAGTVQGTGNTGFANPGAGAVLGRILETRGATVAGMVLVDLVLG